ncbi:MAG: TonB-dependent receptor plug domain-containing protein, partial [Steroidobacteraceae bacterium]
PMPSSCSMALERMLAGTGLTFSFDSPRSVILRPAPKIPPAAPLAARAVIAQPHPLADMTAARLRPVTVTGSLIRGVHSAIAPLVYVRGAQLQQAAYPDIEQALYALPMVSLIGPREDLGVDNNVQYGAGINLRGLGVGATLVLVNGHRQPLGGLTGDFVDVSTIPWSAVRRIEVLPNGASALYGADAVAGVVNIIMRDDFTGAQTEARYGAAPDGRAEWMFAQLFGTHWRGGQAMIDYQYSDATPLAAASRAYAADANKTPYGGANYDSYFSSPGNILDPFTLQPAYGVPVHGSGPLTTADLSTTINLQNPFRAAQIFPDRMAHELYGSVSQWIGSRVELFAQGRYTARNTTLAALSDSALVAVPPSNPFYINPYPTVPYTLVAYNFGALFGPTRFASNSRVYDGTAGATIRLGGHWQMTVSESDGRQSLWADEYGVLSQTALAAALADPNAASAFNPFAADTPANVAAAQTLSQAYPQRSASGIESSDLVADGPVARLPAGEARLAVGVERRVETLDLTVPDLQNPQAPLRAVHYGRRVESVYSQLHVPLVGAAKNAGRAARVALDLAGRYDHYSDFGGTFNPMARLEWIPVPWLKLRASWGRSYRAPKLDDLYDTSQNVSGMTVLVDPQSRSGRSLVLAEQGSNPNLREETARTWTAGFDLSPWRGAQLSVTYYSIDYWNRIEQPATGDPLGILQHAAEWAPVIERNPSAAQIAAICTSPQFIGPVATCLASHPAAIVDLRLANLASTHTRGIDIEARERFVSAWGHFQAALVGTDVLAFDQSVTPNLPATSILDTVGNPLSVRLRGTLSWSRHGRGEPGWGGALAINHTGGYRNPGSTLVPVVSSWTTLDASVHYRLGATRIGQTLLSLNVVNVFNHDPPFVDSEFGYDISNVQALGRVMSLGLTQRW